MIESLVADRISRLEGPAAKALAVVLPGGQHIGSPHADVQLRFHAIAPMRHLVSGNIGALASDCVEGLVDIEGPMRRVVEVAAGLLHRDPTLAAPRADGWRQTLASRWRHRRSADAKQIRHHYDVSDEFYALWLDAKRVYSCAYWSEAAAGMTLAAAQEAKLDHVCRKLMLKPGERFLDIGAGWGALLLWAAERYGVRATGITLSKNQHAHVNRLIAERGLSERVRMLLLDYRDLPEAPNDEPYDKIASIGMFEHVGRANLSTYFAKIRRLLAPGGLLLNHGITAGSTRNAHLGGGIGEFIERWIFPGGELLHVSHVLEAMAEQGLEGLDTENLRPHYARTLWAWSDGLEARLDSARKATDERTVRAYRLYLAGSALGFERGWMALHQMLASRPSGRVDEGALRGSQTSYPWKRDYMYAR
jgi:cyclopropane-fatty-acyl-phospholipid synthase